MFSKTPSWQNGARDSPYGLNDVSGHVDEGHVVKELWVVSGPVGGQGPRPCSLKEMNSANSLLELGSGFFPS